MRSRCKRALHALDELEVHLRQIVVQHQRRDPRLVHLEREHDEIQHQLHVIRDVLRQLVLRPRHVRFARASAASLRGALPSTRSRSASRCRGWTRGTRLSLTLSPLLIFGRRLWESCLHRVENAASSVRPEPSPTRRSNAARRVDLLRRRLGRRDPRQARAVDHRQPVFEAKLVRLDAEHEARDRRPIADLGRDDLIHRRADADLVRIEADGGPESTFMRPRCGLVETCALLVVEALDEDHVLAVRHHRQQRPARAPSSRRSPWPTSESARRRSRRRRCPAEAEAARLDRRRGLTEDAGGIPSMAGPARRPRLSGSDAARSDGSMESMDMGVR